jgi:hypothetical protein
MDRNDPQLDAAAIIADFTDHPDIARRSRQPSNTASFCAPRATDNRPLPRRLALHCTPLTVEQMECDLRSREKERELQRGVPVDVRGDHVWQLV